MKTIPALTKTHCTPSKTGDKALTASQLKKYLAVVPHWILAADGKRIRRKWVAKDFLSALDFQRRGPDRKGGGPTRQFREMIAEGFLRGNRRTTGLGTVIGQATPPHENQRFMAPPCIFSSLP